MILSFALIATAIIGGALATYLYDDNEPLEARLWTGTFLGSAAFGLITFGFSCVFGLTWLPIALGFLFVACVPPFFVGRKNLWPQVRSDVLMFRHNTVQILRKPTRRVLKYAAFYGVLLAVFWFALGRAMNTDKNQISTSYIDNFGDLTFHLRVIYGFTKADNFPPQHPESAGVRLAYPYIVDFTTAVFVRCGASTENAMFLQNFVLLAMFLGVLQSWAWRLTKDRLAAIFVVLLVLFNGGFGWYQVFTENWGKSFGDVLEYLWQPPQEFTSQSELFRWTNSIVSWFVPMRSMTLGLPLFFIVWTLWWKSFGEKPFDEKTAQLGHEDKLRVERADERRMTAAGVIASMLPLAHAHSFLTLMTMGFCTALLFRRWNLWRAFFFAALPLALPQMWWASHGSTIKMSSFVEPFWGWSKGEYNIVFFWLMNTGFVIPLTVLGAGLGRSFLPHFEYSKERIGLFFWRGRQGNPLVPHRLLLFLLPFVLCFIVPNVLKLAPWEWDNIKVLVYWYFASLPIIALLLAHWWRKTRVIRFVAGVLLLSLTFAGGLDVWSKVTQAQNWTVYDEKAIAAGKMIEANTPPHAVVLNAPDHAHPVGLSGRLSVIGYPGRMWTHGLEFSQREDAMREVYQGTDRAFSALNYYGVNYITLGPIERDTLKVNKKFFDNFQKVGESGDMTLYKTKIAVPR